MNHAMNTRLPSQLKAQSSVTVWFRAKAAPRMMITKATRLLKKEICEVTIETLVFRYQSLRSSLALTKNRSR